MKQEQQTGLCCYEAEFWVETCVVQACKKGYEFRTTKQPELLLVNSLLLSAALSDNLHQGTSTRGDQSCWVDNKETYISSIANPDNAMEKNVRIEDYVIGSDHKLLVREVNAWKIFLNTYLGEFPNPLWTDGDVTVSTTLICKRLALKGCKLSLALGISRKLPRFLTTA